MADKCSIPYRLIEQKEETNKLAIILPGAGYTTQAPLLHYTTGIFLLKGFDVIHINYTFTRQELFEINGEDFARDVQRAIVHGIKSKKYNGFYIVAKSIGTLALSYLLKNTMFNEAKVVWLTPLLQKDDVFNSMINSVNKGLCIIGDVDPCFIEERFERLKKNQNLVLKLVDGGNHGLELNEKPIESIEILKMVISDINEF